MTFAALMPLLLAAGVLGGQAAPAAAAATLYVDQSSPACSDSGPGSGAAPFCTIQAAADVVAAGQTVVIEDVTNGSPADYAQAVTVRNSGTAQAPITFTEPRTPGAQTPYVEPAAGAPFTLDHVHDVTVSGLMLMPRGNSDGVDVTGSQNVTLDRLTISQQGSPTAAPDGFLIDGASSGVTVSRSYMDSVYGYDVQVQPGAQNVTVTTNRFLSFGASLGAISVSGAAGAAVTGNSVMAGCGPAIGVEGNTTGTVENNYLGAYSPPASCTAPAAALSVSAAAAAGVQSDYNAVRASAPHAEYSWAGTDYPSAAAFAAGTGQGTHDFDATTWPGNTTPEGSPIIDSADCSAPGELTTDLAGAPRVRDPLVAHTGTGTCYADRGALERQDGLSAGFTSTALTGPAPLDLTVTAPPDQTSPWNEPVTYTADFGDGGGPVTVPAGGTASHTYATPGRYAVTFTAADTGGSGATVTDRVVAATPAAPGASLTALPDTFSGPSGKAIAADAAAFQSAAGPDEWEVASRTVAFGDGTSLGMSAGSTTAHLYPRAGTYTATLTQTDVLGRTSTATAKVVAGDEYLPVGPDGDFSATIAPHSVLKLTPAALHAAFSGVDLAALRLMVSSPARSGSVAVYPDGSARPAGALDFTAGRSASNLVLARVSGGQAVDFYDSSSAAIKLSVATFGIVTGGQDGDTYAPAGPARILDTRYGLGAPRKAVPAHGSLTLAVAGSHGVPAAAAEAVLDITAVGGSAGGYLTAYPHGAANPGTPDVAWGKGKTATGLVVVPLKDGRVVLHNASSGAVGMAADLVGYYHAYGTGAVFLPSAGTVTGLVIGPKHAVKVQIGGRPGIPANGVAAVAAALTASGAATAGYLTAYPDGAANPRTSAVSFAANQATAATALIPAGADGAIRLYNGGTSPVTVRLVLAGICYRYPAVP